MNVSELIRLAAEIGLPYITEEGTITIIGSERNILFNILEETKCQLKEIY
jgi:hypothetical protein